MGGPTHSNREQSQWIDAGNPEGRWTWSLMRLGICLVSTQHSNRTFTIGCSLQSMRIDFVEDCFMHRMNQRDTRFDQNYDTHLSRENRRSKYSFSVHLIAGVTALNPRLLGLAAECIYNNNSLRQYWDRTRNIINQLLDDFNHGLWHKCVSSSGWA